MALYALAENCDYGDITDEMIRDLGIRDTTLSEELQMDSALTLEAVKKAIRQREAVHEGSGKTNADVDAVQYKPRQHYAGVRRRETTPGNRC